MKKRLLLVLFFIIGFLWAQAQIPAAPVNIQSPNATSLGLYGEVPVSFFTGLPIIEVPLYTVQNGGIAVPVSLTYHASGFRPDLHPGWVGMGWNLNAGGIITRVVNDMPDDYNNNNYVNGGKEGFYFNHDVLNVPNWDRVPYMQSIARNDASLNDTEPDEFSFNFLSYSGRFYVGADGKWKVKSDKPIQVQTHQVSPFLDIPFTPPFSSPSNSFKYPKSFGGFTIIVEDGTQFIFGGTTNAIEYSLDFFNQNEDHWIASAWYLVKIIKRGDEINFTYDRDDFINQLYFSFSHNLGTRTVSTGGVFNPQPGCGSFSYNYQDVYSGKLLSPVYLRSIQSADAAIYFDRLTSTELRFPGEAYNYRYTRWLEDAGSNGSFLPYLEENPGSETNFPDCLNKLQWKKLEKIRITYKDQPVRSFELTYNDNSQERLTLHSITEKGVNNEDKAPYTFGYNDSYPLPGYLANQTDHWGFFNATKADMNSYSAYYSYREPSTSMSVIHSGVLKQITYPTGGVTDFEYEQHRYSKQLNLDRSSVSSIPGTPMAAGGLRVRKISNYSLDNPAHKMEKEYFYVEGYKTGIDVNLLLSSGVLGGQVQYYFTDYRAKAFNDDGVVYSQSIFTSQSVLPACSNSQGSHIGYSQVIERRTDGSYTEYSFSNFDNGRYDEAASSQSILQLSRTFYEPYSATGEERGKLLKTDVRNAQDKPVMLREIAYFALNKGSEFVRSLKARKFNVCLETGVSIEEGTAYKFYTYSYLPIKETVTKYDTEGLNPVVTSFHYYYDNPVHRQITRQEEVTSKEERLTTINIYPQDYDKATSADFINPMIAINNVGTPIETVVYKQSNTGTKIISGHINQFRTGTGDYLSKVLNLELNQPLYLADFKFSNCSISGLLPFSGVGEGFIPHESYREKVNYAYEEDRLKDYSPKDGYNTAYVWGYNKSYPIAKVENALSGEVYFDSFEEERDWDNNLTASNSVDHCGNYAGKIEKATPGALISLSNQWLNISLLAARRFKYSGWVYSTNPIAEIYLYMKHRGEMEFFTYVDAIATAASDINKWVYLERELLIPADVTQLTIGLANNGNGTVWFDDIRLHPADATMTSYTYQPLIGMTSSSDADSKPTFYDYDGLGRLKYIKDDKGDIIKQYEYKFVSH